MTVQLSLSTPEAQYLRQLLRDNHSYVGSFAKLASQVGPPPPVCPHTRGPGCGSFPSMESIVRHLIFAHNYADDPCGEDTAQSNAWHAWHDR